MTVNGAAAVTHGSTACVPTLHDALIAVTLGGAGHVNEVALFESVRLDDVADVQLGGVVQVELAEILLGSHARLVQVTHLGLGQLALGDVLKAQLHSGVAFLLGSLLLDNGAGTRLNNSNGDDLAVFVEDLRHTDFLANDCLHV